MINITNSLDWILQIENPSMYKVLLNNHGINNSDIELTKEEREYAFVSSTPIIKGIQTHKELEFKEVDKIIFSKPERNLNLTGNHFFVKNIQYDTDNMRKIISGSISSFASSLDPISFTNKYLRMVLPLKKGKINMYSFQARHLPTDDGKSCLYIPVNIEGKTYRFYTYKYGDREFILMDSEDLSSIEIFRKITYNILLTYGFIKGSYFSDECYVITFDDSNFNTPKDINYHSTRSTVITNQAIHTSNPFSVYHDFDFERDEKYEIKKEVQDKLYEGVTGFPALVFSKLSEAFYLHEKFQRAAVLFIHGHKATLEMRLPNYYVALEAITAQIVKLNAEAEKENLKPIKDDKVADNFILAVKKLAEEAKRQSGLENQEFDMEIIEKNILKLNAAPNADKLGKAFGLIGYDIQLIPDSKMVLKERNTYLHGSFSVHADDEKTFQTALHIGLRLHFMIAVLLLKHCGFSGKIINYAELWKHITQRPINEDRLVMI